MPGFFWQIWSERMKSGHKTAVEIPTRLRKKAFLHEYSKALEQGTRETMGPEQQHLNVILTFLWAVSLIRDFPRPLPNWIILWLFENRGIVPMQKSYPLSYEVKHLTLQKWQFSSTSLSLLELTSPSSNVSEVWATRYLSFPKIFTSSIS